MTTAVDIFEIQFVVFGLPIATFANVAFELDSDVGVWRWGSHYDRGWSFLGLDLGGVEVDWEGGWGFVNDD